MRYRGFDIYLPKQMSEAEPYLIVKGDGNYQVRMADSFTGNLVRLDNFFNSFEEKIVNRYRRELMKLKEHKEALKIEMAKSDDVPEKLEDLLRALNEINERMKLNDE